ncbi:MAG: 50S ribosomal protein L11, partial [Candidatus Lokiarchaeota archaeon]|nr:50S ribosomal protein L11 [Candidatus Lokiarchaeota archaeon]
SINSSEQKSGDLTLEQVIAVTNAKKDIFLAKNFKNAVKTVIGTALSIGATVEGSDPKDVQKRIDAGEYDDKIQEEI